MIREKVKGDPVAALHERAGRLRNKARLIVTSYRGRQIDDAWSWLLDTAEFCELVAEEVSEHD